MAATQRVRSRVPAPQRSVLPSVPGVPAWGAVLIAVACTLLGFLIDAVGDSAELTASFAALYIAGCVAAVLTVRFRGIFTTMVLPPLLLFLAVPLAYQQLTGRISTGLKDILLNLAIPLVNRFPTMILATALVLAIGGARIMMVRRESATERSKEARRGSSWGRSAVKRRDEDEPAEPARRRLRRPQQEVEEDPVTDKYEPPRPGRRPSNAVADAPPRVGANGRGRDGRPAGRGQRPSAVSRPEAEPQRGARGRAEVPPHPQPNVRYRERDSSSTQRRKPESL
ncbi:DUF6542 domain-containing protein [Nocardia sp. bgisy134]|uniref:DUF6542 domain-containing protein n=1 Tax=Nocardia sp. bgisy134 TaxID=3413789 RepID=UPI003D72EF93